MDSANRFVVAASPVIAIAWMVWLGPGAGGSPFAHLPWWQWPIEAAIIGMTWVWWTLAVVLALQVTLLLAQALGMACVLLLIRWGARRDL